MTDPERIEQLELTLPTKRGPMTGRPIPEMTERDIARFFAKVNKTDSHWLWTAAVNNWGYPAFGMGNGSCFLAHRVSLKLAGVEIPPGLVVDHVCKIPRCVNPAHLRVVTPSINAIENNDSPLAKNRRKTHCKYGHELAGANIRTTYTKGPRGTSCVGRVCLACYQTCSGGAS